MCTAVQQYATFQNVLDAHANGWYFAVYETSLTPSVDDNIQNVNQGNNSSTSMPEQSEDTEYLASDDFKKAKETESEKLSRQEKQKQYMRKHRRRIKNNETEEGNLCEVCHEAWPLSSKGKKKSPICSRCSHDKNGTNVNSKHIYEKLQNC